MENHSREPWHTKTTQEVLEAFQTTVEGLSDAEAEKRLQQYGKNALHQSAKRTVLQMIKTQITDPMVLILIGASVFSAVLKE